MTFKHAFLITVLEDIDPFMRRIDPDSMKNLEPGEKAELPLTYRENYSFTVFQSLMKVSDVFDQIEKSLFYLRSKGKVQASKQGPRFNEWTWIEYHFSYFSIIHSALTDRILILVNDVLELGNPPRNCRKDVIKKNIHVPDDVQVAIDKIDRKASRLRRARNESIHHGETLNIAKIMKSSLLDKLKLFCIARGLSSTYEGPAVLQEALKLGRGQIRDFMRRTAKESARATCSLLDVLLPIYDNTKASK